VSKGVIRAKYGNIELSLVSAMAPAPEDLIPLEEMPNPRPEWLPYICSLRFANQPGAATLAAELHRLRAPNKTSF